MASLFSQRFLARAVPAFEREFGVAATYSRGALSGSVTLLRDDSAAIANDGSGMVTEIALVEFVGTYADLATFGDPQRFDRITVDGLTYEVQPRSEKCFYVECGRVHIHAKQVHA